MVLRMRYLPKGKLRAVAATQYLVVSQPVAYDSSERLGEPVCGRGTDRPEGERLSRAAVRGSGRV
jgi:hypothetical protein